MSTAQGRREWAQSVSELESLTLASLAAPPATPLDAATWVYRPAEPSAAVAAFLEERGAAFDRDVWGGAGGGGGGAGGADGTQRGGGGGGAGAAVLPLYMPRVSMIEALHACPAEPHAADAFRLALPDRVSELELGGPDWLGMCTSAADAVTRRLQQQQQQQQSGLHQDGAAAQAVAPQRRMVTLADPGRAVDFIPIILVPGGASAVVQLANVRELLETGVYAAPQQKWLDASSGETSLAARDKTHVFVSPSKVLSVEPAVKFRQFRVVDDPALVANWSHVCATFVTGDLWQFEGWYGGDPHLREPRNLFDVHVKGFMPYFEDEKGPDAIKHWRVVPLQLSRRASKAHMSLRVARIFWEELFAFLERHPHFRSYTLDAPRGATAPHM